MDGSPVNPYAAPRADPAPAGRPQLTNGEMRAFLGSEDSYYEGKWFGANLSGGWYGGFNWAAAIFGSLWMFYRRMYVEGAIAYGVGLALSFALSFVNRHLLGGALKGIAGWVLVICSVATGVAGNALYLRRARVLVGEVRQDLHLTDPERVLSRGGSPSWRAVFVGFLAQLGVALLLSMIRLV